MNYYIHPLISKHSMFKIISICIIITISFLSCNWSDYETRLIDFDNTTERQITVKQDSSNALRVAIATMISPKKTYTYYESLFTYISKKLNMDVYFKQISSYKDVNQLLCERSIDMAFICTGPYISISDHVNLLVVPIVNGEPYYQGYIITRLDSDIASFKELKGKTFIYTDPISNTGRNFPELKVRELSENPELFFKSTSYSYSHDLSIDMVSKNLVDGAAVDALVFDFLEQKEPEKIKNIRIIDKSEKYAMPPVVVSLSVSENVRKNLQDIFVNMHLDSSGRKILENLNIDKFIIADDTLYNNTRKSMIVY